MNSADSGHGPGPDDGLDPVERLAVAYAPASVRAAWRGYLAFDHRLADAAREGRDPIMIQLRLAWWRDRMAEPAAHWPAGEPLLATLAAWDTERPALSAMVDGWEARNVGSDGGAALASARIDAIEALARLGGARDESVLADVRRAAAEWHDGKGEGAIRLPRAMRPLAVLRGMALRGEDGPPLARFLALLRLGMLGR